MPLPHISSYDNRIAEEFNRYREDFTGISSRGSSRSVEPQGRLDMGSEEFTISTEQTKEAIREFLIQEIGSFVGSGFNIEKAEILKQIEDEVATLKEHIKTRLDKISEEIYSELISRKNKEEVERLVTEKLNKLKESL